MRPLDVHVVAHTHWDREWYLPAGRFRQRLVALVDELLDDPPPAGASFLLDGQSIALEDYLAVRPERASELAVLLREGRLEAGPWYVLADELIPGGEALVRNLLVGRRQLAALRARAPRVLYCPDSFGHPAALPELAAGFGLDVVVLWRGYGSRRWPAGDCVWWRAPSGARALVHHLPRDGYEYGSHLPSDPGAARARWTSLRAELGPRAVLGPVLLTNGADHHARQREWTEAVAALAESALPDAVQASSLEAFAVALTDAARAASLPEIAGELRDSYGYTWTLQGTFATRAHQKRRNARAERLLLREAEPWSALSRRAGGAPRRPLVDAAWRTLLQCHPHDTLCGCSIDEVARAMDARLDEATVQGEGLCDDALLDLVGHDRARARERPADWRSVVLLRNAAARPREGVAILHLVTKLRDVPVGPGSAGAAAAVAELEAQLPPLPALPLQVLEVRTTHERIESPRHYPDEDLVAVATVAALVPRVAAYGVSVLGTALGGAALEPPASLSTARASESQLANGLLHIDVQGQGRLALATADGARSVEGFVAFEDHADVGDLYTPSIRGRIAEARHERTTVLHAGPIRAALEQQWTLAHLARPAGSAATLTLRVSLDAASPVLRISVRGENLARDHRLRLVLSTGVSEPEVWADAAFGPVRRAPIEVPPEDAAMEVPPRTAPLHRYLSLFGAAGGATLYSDGLAEYEVLADGRIAVTLVRAVGELSRLDLPERPGNAGWPTPTPGAQCLHPFEAELALLLHGGHRDDETMHLIECTADDVLLPLTGRTLRSAIDVRDAAGIALEGEGLAFSAMKDAADGDWVVLRCVNLLDHPVQGRWRSARPFVEAQLARLDETPRGALPLDGDTIPFVAGPRAVVTILAR